MIELSPSCSVVTVPSKQRDQGSGHYVTSRGPIVVGLGCGHKLTGFSQAGILPHFWSVRRSPEYVCCHPVETRDPAALKGEHDLWKPCHRNNATAPGSRKPDAICSLIFRLWEFKFLSPVGLQEATKAEMRDITLVTRSSGTSLSGCEITGETQCWACLGAHS